MSSSTEPHVSDEYYENMARVRDVAIRYRDDADFRAAIDGGDLQEAIDYLGLEVPAGITPKLHFDSEEVMHIALPPDVNQMLRDESLISVAGGKTAGTAGTVGTASTLACSCLPSSASTASSAGTVGSAGCDNT